MRGTTMMMKKVDGINKIRAKKSEALVAEGKPALEPYTFDYLLLCNKICGSAHYKMKMIVVVLGKSEFKNWMEIKNLYNNIFICSDAYSKNIFFANYTLELYEEIQYKINNIIKNDIS